MVELVILMFKDNCLSKFLTKKMHIFKFSITYGDGSTTAGSFVNDSLTFNQVNGNLHNAAENSSVVFGCGAKQSGTLGSSSDEALDGIIGFGQSNSSVLSQLAASGKEELRAPQESQHGDAVMEAFVKGRSGSVLGKGSILKMCSMNPRH
ncbi:aspartic proteinase 36-like isoform X4 [Trifolium pratense]|uniref:aspartic proteinase 36-like isoform X4 n=1 Tax=Trifolium pratense TaxID=57577 RepID=UPI001E690380|nr:aspartic proteinase 36-like isoform X4 [Trifolium pratense]